MRRRARLVVVVLLVVLLVLGGGAAFVFAGRAGAGVPPRGAPPAVPAAGPGSGVVELSADAAGHPAGDAVRAQLQRHFDGINGRDYEQWRETVVAQRSAALPEPAWQDAYASTVDGTIRIDRIDDEPGGTLLARVRFVSTQAVEDAPVALPVERICWRSTLPMSAEQPPRIGMTQGGSSVAAAC